MNIETFELPHNEDCLARWLALIEGIGLIEETAQKKKIDLDRFANLLKPLALQKYIQERMPALVEEIKHRETRS